MYDENCHQTQNSSRIWYAVGEDIPLRILLGIGARGGTYSYPFFLRETNTKSLLVKGMVGPF